MAAGITEKGLVRRRWSNLLEGGMATRIWGMKETGDYQTDSVFLA